MIDNQEVYYGDVDGLDILDELVDMFLYSGVPCLKTFGDENSIFITNNKKWYAPAGLEVETWVTYPENERKIKISIYKRSLSTLKMSDKGLMGYINNAKRKNKIIAISYAYYSNNSIIFKGNDYSLPEWYDKNCSIYHTYMSTDIKDPKSNVTANHDLIKHF